MPLRPEAPKIKVQWFNDPARTREFTKQAWDFIQGPNLKWVVSADQSQPVEAKKKVVVPVEVKDHKPELREKYKVLTGKDADEVWNEARLYVEISKAEKSLSTVIEPVKVEVHAPEQPAPKKRGRKAKVTV